MPARTVRSSGNRSRSAGADALPPPGRTLPTVSAVRYGTEGLRLRDAVMWPDLAPSRAVKPRSALPSLSRARSRKVAAPSRIASLGSVVLAGPSTTLPIDAMREGAATFRLRARDKLGNADLGFTARLGPKSGHITASRSEEHTSELQSR